ncbi:MAG: glycosyltransferase family 4 protein, partial [Acidobacteriota bacterium]
ELAPSDCELHVDTLPVDLERLAPPAETVEPAAERELVFLGNFRHPPNIDAARRLIEGVLPRVRARRPNVRCTLVGAFPPDDLFDRAATPWVRVTGFVDDFRPFLWSAAAFVAPIDAGAGMRVKVLEALAAGAPVVATPLAMHGLGAVSHQHCLIGRSDEELAEHVLSVLRDGELEARLRRGGRQLASRHGIEARAEHREAIWRRAMHAAGARSSVVNIRAKRGADAS